ncbi:MAG: hypothetical protein KJP02_02485 [Octadecabacter sp.]|nr:hypothetical protein [Octadecabacter sp.]
MLHQALGKAGAFALVHDQTQNAVYQPTGFKALGEQLLINSGDGVSGIGRTETKASLIAVMQIFRPRQPL